MRVLAISNFYPPHHIGGYELSCRDVLRRFERRGHEVAVLTSDVRSPGQPDEDPGHAVWRELRLYWRDHELLSPGPVGRLSMELHNRRALCHALDELRPDVVSVWNMGAMSLGLLATVASRRHPMVLVVCDDWLVYGSELDAWTRPLMRRPRSARWVRALTGLPTGPPDLGAYRVCFVSDFVRRRAEAESPWLFSRSTVTGSGVERAEFVPAGAGGSSALAETAKPWSGRLLYAGRLDPRKGIETALHALAQLPDTTLDVVGPGPAGYRRHLDDLAADLGVERRVRFDVVPRAELSGHYAAADAVVFPSEWDEPFGLVPVEAMACGTPVVATGTGGSAEVLREDENCLLFPPGDPAALAQAIHRLARDPALRRRLVSGGFRTAEAYDVERLADVLERWHLDAAGELPGVPVCGT